MTIEEAEKKILALENKNNALESRLNNLEDRLNALINRVDDIKSGNLVQIQDMQDTLNLQTIKITRLQRNKNYARF